jgi:hypothetical protein
MKIFNKKRKKLVYQNQFKEYLIYAIGEIFLVVVGILIALKVNNYNETQILNNVTNDYLIKIRLNVLEDLKETERLLKFRNENSDLCNEVSAMLIANDFSDQMKIQEAIINMMVEVELNYSRSAFESLKNSGHLSYIENSTLETLLFDYYINTDQILMREIDQKNWANELEVELDRKGFIYDWTQLDKKVITDLFALYGNYNKNLKSHPGHKIVMRLLFRGGTNKSIMSPLYIRHIELAKKLIEEIDLYLKDQ